MSNKNTQTRFRFNCVKLLLDRIKEKSKTEESASDEYYCDLLAFFIFCWSLKDFIKNDTGIIFPDKNKIEEIVKPYESLMKIADLANGSKHLTLDRYKKKDSKIGVKEIYVNENFSTGKTTSWAEYRITSNDGSVDNAIDLAIRAVADWETIFNKCNL